MLASAVKLIERTVSVQSGARQLSTRADAFGEFAATAPRRVVVTGLGLVTPLGIGVERAWQSLVDGECGIRAITAGDLPKEQQAAFAGLAAKVAGLVDNDELRERCNGLGVPSDSTISARCVQFALLAAAEALRDARWQPQDSSGRERTGVAIGSGMSATADLGKAGQIVGAGQPRKLSPFLVPRILANMAAGAVSMQHGFMGPNHCASTACTTGAHSIGDALNFIRRGDADVMVAGGTEACVDAISIGSFGRMRALETRYNDSPAAASRPFDAGRGGFVIGEGAGVVVLEELQHAMRRKASIYAEVRGYGLSADAHHVTQPAPDGRGAILAMQRAFQGSGVPKSALGYINAHATSTPLGDAIEAASIASMFGLQETSTAAELLSNSTGEGPWVEERRTESKSQQLLVSSTKGATGHLLGAAGAVEAIFSILALHNSTAPPTLNLQTEEPRTLGSSLVSGTCRRLPHGARAAMSNSFGFGGTNASLLFTAPPA